MILRIVVMILMTIKNMMMLVIRKSQFMITPRPPQWFEIFHDHDFEYDFPNFIIIIIITDIVLNDDPDIDDQKVYRSNALSLHFHLNS